MSFPVHTEINSYSVTFIENIFSYIKIKVNIQKFFFSLLRFTCKTQCIQKVKKNKKQKQFADFNPLNKVIKYLSTQSRKFLLKYRHFT